MHSCGPANCSRCRPSACLLIGEENYLLFFCSDNHYFRWMYCTTWKCGGVGCGGKKEGRKPRWWLHDAILKSCVPQSSHEMARRHAIFPFTTPNPSHIPHHLYTKRSLTPSLCMRLGSCQLDEAHTTPRVQKVMGRTSSPRPSTHTHTKHCSNPSTAPMPKAQSDAKIVKAIHIALLSSTQRPSSDTSSPQSDARTSQSDAWK